MPGTKTSEKVNFTADVHLIQILGEQLIGSEKVGILELIKNAYDAGAQKCDVWIEKVPGLPEAPLSDPELSDLPGPVITIIDDGRGMDKKTILQGWLRPATRIKTSVKVRLKAERAMADKRGTRAEFDGLVEELKKAHGGRLPLGEKGVGRFAAHRLGRYMRLFTKSEKEPFERELLIDWNIFIAPDENPLDLEQVEFDLIEWDTPSHDYGKSDSGTVLRIYGGRSGFEWTEEKLIDIGNSIVRLKSPHTSSSEMGFDIEFHCPQLTEKFEVLTETVPAPFRLVAVVDEKGIAEYEIRFIPPPSLKVPMPEEIWEGKIDPKSNPPEDDPNHWFEGDKKTEHRMPECGPFTLDLKLWLRTGDWIEYPRIRDFTDYLDRFGGIGIYRDGLSILPAQKSSQDDWLELSKRHIKKGWNISYYMMSGSVDLVQEKTLDLIDRTSREGLLETRPFSDLTTLLRALLVPLEMLVQDIRDKYTSQKRGSRVPPKKLRDQTLMASKALKAFSNTYDFRVDPENIKNVFGPTENTKEALLSTTDTLEKVAVEIKDLDERNEALLEVAGYGIAIAVAVHEIEKITSNLYHGLDSLLEKPSAHDKETYATIDRLHGTAQSLLNELKRIAPLRVTRLERPQEFNIRDAVLVASGAFRTSWDELQINFFPPSKDTDFSIYGSFGACSQVFANLFDNATYWIKNSAAKERRIIVRVNTDTHRVYVADSGPNIDEQMRPYLFEPFYSLKVPPAGLGLYICRFYMRQMKGSIRESHRNERIPGVSGAHFTLSFPKRNTSE